MNLNTIRISGVLMTIMMLLAILGGTTSAVKPADRGNGGGRPGGGDDATSEPYGLDVSWPQCGKTLPTDQAFAIVGVNDGLANTTNECLAEQLAWGAKSLGGTEQPKLQLYVNTANPSGLGTDSWPTNNVDPAGNISPNPHDVCNGNYTDSYACAWQYGWNRAVEDVIERFEPVAVEAGINANSSSYVWWLDVETMNSWLPPSDYYNYKSNIAVLEGMTTYFEGIGATVALYSTAYQWNEITGGQVGLNSNLNGLANWRPSGKSLKNAKNNCSVDPLTTGGFISMTQYIKKNLDHNYSCL